jgi:hypothetical protein
MWQWILAILASLASDPEQVDRERPAASAAISAARASMQPDAGK